MWISTGKRGWVNVNVGKCLSEQLFSPSSYSSNRSWGNVLIKLLFFNYIVENLSIGEEVAHKTLVTMNQLIAQKWKDLRKWDANNGILLRHKST